MGIHVYEHGSEATVLKNSKEDLKGAHFGGPFLCANAKGNYSTSEVMVNSNGSSCPSMNKVTFLEMMPFNPAGSNCTLISVDSPGASSLLVSTGMVQPHELAIESMRMVSVPELVRTKVVLIGLFFEMVPKS